MRTRFWTPIALGAALAAAQNARAADQQNALLIMGSGFTGTWNTELRIANPTGTALPLQVGGFPFPTACTFNPCPPPYPVHIELAPNGEQTVLFTDVFSGTALQFLYVLPSNSGDPLPVVRARAYNVAQPARAMELPITSYAALTTRNNSPLDFPGAERSGTAHSNLIIAEVSQAAGATARIDAIAPDGTTVATRNISLASGQNLFLIDVLTTMGLDTFSGHLRVTSTGGAGIIDGALATLTDDGGFAVSAGFNP
jgi:hypothetical protein